MDVKIFEVLTKGYDPAEAVRIFVQFDKVDGAVKASIDLKGRFFGGKEVGNVGGAGAQRVGEGGIDKGQSEEIDCWGSALYYPLCLLHDSGTSKSC